MSNIAPNQSIERIAPAISPIIQKLIVIGLITIALIGGIEIGRRIEHTISTNPIAPAHYTPTHPAGLRPAHLVPSQAGYVHLHTYHLDLHESAHAA